MAGQPFNPARRKFIKVSIAAGVVALTGSAVDAFAIEPESIHVHRVKVAIKDLPASLQGLSIAQLTDIHHGRLVDIAFVRQMVAAANAAKPDVIVITGDNVSRPDAASKAFSEALSKLHAPLGCFGVPGNHDHTCGLAKMKQVFSDAGIGLLINRHVILSRGQDKLCLAGVDDLWRGTMDVAAALDGVDKDLPRILLSHNPDLAESLPAGPRVDLMLCGHTHGGQLRLPFAGPLIVPIRHRQYAAGLARGPRCQVYTSCGLGMVGLPARFNCPPELPVIVLARA